MAQLRSKPVRGNKQNIDHEKLGRMLADVYETGYANRKRMYKMSFIKGLFGGLGGVIGATIVVAVMLWLLSFFQEVPLLDRLYDNLQDNVNNSQQ